MELIKTALTAEKLYVEAKPLLYMPVLVVTLVDVFENEGDQNCVIHVHRVKGQMIQKVNLVACFVCAQNKDAKCHVQYITVYFWFLQQSNDKKLAGHPREPQTGNYFSVLVWGLSNDTFMCEITFFSWMSHSSLREDITEWVAEATRLSEKTGAKQSCLSYFYSFGSHVEATNLWWHFCLLE